MAAVPTAAMAAAVYDSTTGGLDKTLRYEKAAAPPPPIKDGETLVRVAYAAINPADYKITEIPYIGSLFVKRPATPGFDFSGRVVETKNPDLKQGQRVFGRLDVPPPRWGTAAEYTVAPKEGCVALPDKVSLADGATIGTAGQTAWQCVAPTVQAHGPGARVLVNGGSGGTGTFAVQIAKALGAHVTTTCSAGNARMVKDLGADDAIDYRTTDVSRALADRVAADPAAAFDVVFDAVGQPADLHRAADAFMTKDGKFNQVGAEFNAGDMAVAMKRMALPSFLGGGSRAFKMVSVFNSAADLRMLASLVADGRVRPVIDSTFKLEATAEAFAKLRTGRTKGKILIEVAGESV